MSGINVKGNARREQYRDETGRNAIITPRSLGSGHDTQEGRLGLQLAVPPEGSFLILL